jgi:hypothetical protein
VRCNASRLWRLACRRGVKRAPLHNGMDDARRFPPVPPPHIAIPFKPRHCPSWLGGCQLRRTFSRNLSLASSKDRGRSLPFACINLEILLLSPPCCSSVAQSDFIGHDRYP